MSIADDFDELERAANEISNQLSDPLNLKAVYEQQVAEVNRFKSMRKSALATKARIEQQIKAIDVRIEMALSAIKTIQTPK